MLIATLLRAGHSECDTITRSGCARGDRHERLSAERSTIRTRKNRRAVASHCEMHILDTKGLRSEEVGNLMRARDPGTLVCTICRSVCRLKLRCESTCTGEVPMCRSIRRRSGLCKTRGLKPRRNIDTVKTIVQDTLRATTDLRGIADTGVGGCSESTSSH